MQYVKPKGISFTQRNEIQQNLDGCCLIFLSGGNDFRSIFNLLFCVRFTAQHCLKIVVLLAFFENSSRISVVNTVKHQTNDNNSKKIKGKKEFFVCQNNFDSQMLQNHQVVRLL